ncbi:amino acid transporter, transmembrane domain-containing protein [Artemisia annua]|uniref:Amino acid transporter, transmembrane domain-containing protein n=1 Tax=Artemisia annua TaxID=35608 RepID=A0A2U1PSE2_ARTAN|nr:amino acid transporter, transmembrane domain-containing protein [Artemisia annua]
MSEQENVAIESLSVESTGPAKGGAGLENALALAHTVDHGQTHGDNLFTMLLLGNMGFLLLGGRALKVLLIINTIGCRKSIRNLVIRFETPDLYSDHGCSILCFCIFGSYGVISEKVVTNISSSYLHLQKSNKDRNYDIYGSNFSKVMNGFGAISAIIVCNTGGILPELQSTLRKPAVKNMRKALYLQYTVGLFFYYGVSIVGYWAYGSAVSAYLPKDLNGPKWANPPAAAAISPESCRRRHCIAGRLLPPADVSLEL